MALIAVTVTSVVIVRRRLRYETWYFVHLYAYLGVALAFSHQLATGSSFVGRPGARAYWYALYAITLGALVVFRIGLPLWRSARHRLRVLRVVDEGPGVVSLEIGGRQLGRLRARPGQFFTWRFLTRRHWWEAHPFSLSAAPDGRRLRITVKALGDHTRSLRDVEPGTRVIAEGPFGGFRPTGRGVALIAGGIGITPVRALLEDLPGDVAVVYRVAREEDVILRSELDELAHVHYVIGEAALSPGAAAPAGARPRRARRVRLRPAGHDRGGAGDGRAATPGLRRAVRALMRRAAVALVLTAVAVVLLARYETSPPVTRSADDPRKPPAIATPAPAPPGSVSALGPALTTPFSAIQVRATLLRGELVGVETVAMSGDGPHTDALNARAEPILRERVLRAGNADVDVVTGATSSSEIWLESLRGAIREARRAG